MTTTVLIALSPQDASLLKLTLSEMKRDLRGSNPVASLRRRNVNPQNGVVAFTPEGGIPAAEPTVTSINGTDYLTAKMVGKKCKMYQEEPYMEYGSAVEGSLSLVPIFNPDGTQWEEYIYHLDPVDDVAGNIFINTWTSKWGTRYALWESCNTWPSIAELQA